MAELRESWDAQQQQLAEQRAQKAQANAAAKA
jgi:hypothetical protein